MNELLANYEDTMTEEYLERTIRIHYDPNEGDAISDGKAVEWAQSLEPGKRYDVSSEIAINALSLCVAKKEIIHENIEITYVENGTLTAMYLNEHGNSQDWFEGVAYDLHIEKFKINVEHSREKRKFSVAS